MKFLVFTLFCFQLHAAEKSTEAIKPLEPNPAPTIPGNEVLLFDISNDAAGNLTLSKGINITQHPGYDSQPRFSNDGEIIYYTRAVTTNDKTQMDIYQYALATGETKPYMTTKESEYSPTPMPNGEVFSVVQVDAAGDQYLVMLDAAAEGDKKMQRYSDLKQVGYFNWTAGGQNWSFILNDSNGGDLYHTHVDKKAQLISKNVGRTFVNDTTKNHIYFVDKNTIPWRIKSRSNSVDNALDIMALPLGVEDFTFDSQGRFWAGRDNTLFMSDDQKRWYIVHEFNDPKLHQITRLTTNPKADKIAIVFAEINGSE